ncbi:hypothetical protein ES703_41119 [subsurface metagenome]
MPLLWTPSHVVADITLPGNTTNIDVANLDYNNDGPWQFYLMVHNPTGSTTEYRLFFNGDYVIANYYAQWIKVVGGVRSSARINKPNVEILSAGLSSIVFGTIMVDAADYARFHGINCRKITTALELIEYGICKNSTVANITSLRIASTIANGLSAGTRLIITRIAH